MIEPEYYYCIRLRWRALMPDGPELIFDYLCIWLALAKLVDMILLPAIDAF